MSLTSIVDSARLLLRDTAYPHRWPLADVLHYVNDGVRAVIKHRPDAQINDDLELAAVEDIPLMGCFAFTESGANQGVVKGYELLQGWRYTQNPKLFFAIKSGTGSIYASADERSAGASKRGVFPVSAAGFVKVSAQLLDGASSGLGGNVILVSTPSTAEWEVTVSETSDATLCITGFDTELAYYIAYRCLSEDSADTINAARADEFHKEFLRLLLGA